MWKGVGAVAIDTHLDKPAQLSGRCVLPIRELSDRHLGVIFHTYKQVKLIRQQWALQTNGMGVGVVFFHSEKIISSIFDLPGVVLFSCFFSSLE